VKYYLKNEKERREIAKNGWKKCMENYTPYHRMLNVFNEIEKENQKRVYITYNKKFELEMKKNYCKYYLYFVKAFILAGNKKFAFNTLILAQKNNPLNLKLYLYYMLLIIPYSLYSSLISAYKKLKQFKKVIYNF
ncbi:MAG: glycosyltransferase, partial [Candidatus Omnitrophica bacterium]|nr:glycosyltransferase [Candidatus Omnitrophota bacterium]